jgi:hypothetical protein
MKHFPFVGCTLVVVGLFLSASGVSMLAQGNSSVGSWELNVAKVEVQSRSSPEERLAED